MAQLGPPGSTFGSNTMGLNLGPPSPAFGQAPLGFLGYNAPMEAVPAPLAVPLGFMNPDMTPDPEAMPNQGIPTVTTAQVFNSVTPLGKAFAYAQPTPVQVDPHMQMTPQALIGPPAPPALANSVALNNALLGTLANQQSVQDAMQNLAFGPPEGYEQAFAAPMSMSDALNATVAAMNPAMSAPDDTSTGTSDDDGGTTGGIGAEGGGGGAAGAAAAEGGGGAPSGMGGIGSEGGGGGAADGGTD